MKKVLFVWLLCTGCSVNTTSSVQTTGLLISDSAGNRHSYRFLKIDRDNWCEIHQKYEFVERRIYYKNYNMRGNLLKN
jgi:hypothetical protein